MDIKRQARLEARAGILKAMAHPSRLLILEELGQQERSVGELTDMIGSDISTVSKHLSILKTEGIIIDEKRGSSVFYKLRCKCVLNFYECVEGVIKANAEEKAGLLD